MWVAQTCQEARQGSDGPTGLGDDSLALTHPDHWTCERYDTALGTLAQLGEGGHLLYDWHAQFRRRGWAVQRHEMHCSS